MPQLLEREGDLEVLRTALAAAATRRGSVVLISGEAGIGKSTVVQAWTRDPATDARMLVGWCDDFLTSRILGPLHDVARTTGGTLADAVARSDTSAVLDAVLGELENPLRPTALVLEDVHWADEATLDVVRYIGRRIHRLPAVLVVTYRDDTDADHPLRGVIGALPRDSVHRISLRPLTSGAVAELTAGSDLDPDDVVRVTGGNPFFVTEIAHGSEQLPASVADAVEARVRALPEGAREVVQLLSVVPGGASRELVDALHLEAADLATAEARGVLVVDERTVHFRHELARLAVRALLPAAARVTNHQHVLEALLTSDDAVAILHHAVESGRGDLIAKHGPRAADEAFRAGAHRQAVAHQTNVLRYRHLLDPIMQAQLHEQQSWTLYNLHRFSEAVEAAASAVAIRETLGDPVAHGRSLCVLGRMHYIANAPDDALTAIEAGAALMAAHGDAAERAEAVVARTALYALTDQPNALTVAEEAVTAARAVGRPDLVSLALNYRGVARDMLGDDTAVDDLQESVRLALDHGQLEVAARAYTNLASLWVPGDQPPAVVLPLLDVARAFLEDHDLASHAFDIRARQARVYFDLGDWDDAEAQLRALRATTDQHGVIDLMARETIARLAVRRGDDDADTLVEEAWELAVRSGAGQYLGAIGAVRVEQAWLAGDPAAARERLAAIPVGRVRPRMRAEVLRYAQLAGLAVEVGADLPEPWASGLRGDWRVAADAWKAQQNPYQRAIELLASGESEATLEALEVFDRLGARPAARLARQALRELGIRRVPRGPVATTREHPAGLTGRQAEVLELLADGLTNAQIAQRLVVSVRTVDHHVTAILRKLGVSSRREAVTQGGGSTTGDVTGPTLPARPTTPA